MVDITPTFNPTGASSEEIYATGRASRLMKLHAEQVNDREPIEVWRIVDRTRLIDGTGITSSQILLDGTLGDIEMFNVDRHFGGATSATTSHESRTSDPRNATPFVSFSTDPKFLAQSIAKGFGTSEGRDSVVIRATVDPDRFVSHGQNKEKEVYLVGGLAPDEYTEAYNPADFVDAMLRQPAERDLALV